MSYLVAIGTDAHQSYVEMCVRDIRTAMKTAGGDVNSSRKNSSEILCGACPPPPLPLYTRELIYI